MSFIKLSKTERIAFWEDGQTIRRCATLNKIASYFADAQNTNKIDVSTALAKVANDYDISPNPKDYLFEAVRAVTAGVPNENGDAFHKNELLRYDHRLRQAVYQTFILKPHHVNHRADDPKTARGVILDAHYNDQSAALDTCPNPECLSKTAALEGRDATGLYCRKCGSTVKDEFIEILIAVDKRKDPNFAEGVRTGVLNATSMGCVCDSTTCNVCDHVAYNRNEFCAHIRSGNKKKTFKTASGDKIAFEWCNNVCFTEDSRVDQPADPKALQQEILSLSARRAAMGSDLARETDVLILQKQINELQLKVAQMLPPTQMSPSVDPGQPGVPAEPGSIENFVQEQTHEMEGSDPMSKEEMGILDAPAIAPDGGLGTKASLDQNILDELDGLAQRYASQHHLNAEVAKMDLKFKNAYGNVRAAITQRGNCRVFTPAGTLFVIQPTDKLNTDAERKAFSTTVLGHIAEHGIVPTIRAFEATKGAKFAQILEHHLEDFAKGRETGDTKGQHEGGDQDMKNERGELDKSLISDQSSDRADMVYEKKTLQDSALGGHQEDFEGKNRPDKTYPGSVQDDAGRDQKEGPSKKTLSNSVLEGIELDHQQKVAQVEGSKSKPSTSKPSKSKPSKPSASKPPSKTTPSTPAAKEATPPAQPAASTPPPPDTTPPAEGGSVVPMQPEPTAQDLVQQFVAVQATISDLQAQAAGISNQLGPMMKEIQGKAMQVGKQLYQVSQQPDVAIDFKMVMFDLFPHLDESLQSLARFFTDQRTTVQPGPTNVRPIRGQMEDAGAMGAAKDVLMILDQIMSTLSGGAAVNPADGLAGPPMNDNMEGGMQMAASKKGLPSFIKDKKGGSRGSKPSKLETSSKERANSDGGKTAALVKEAELKNLELRMERLYKGRIATLTKQSDKRIADLTTELTKKFTRALKLAMQRQALNLETAPLKVAFADVLLTPMDLGRGEYYPGMDESLTVTLIERAAALGMDSFINTTVSRAADLMKLSDEAFGHIEADVKNLQPVSPVVAELEVDDPRANTARTAARDGNLQLASRSSEITRHDRTQLQQALSVTKIQRQHGHVIKR